MEAQSSAETQFTVAEHEPVVQTGDEEKARETPRRILLYIETPAHLQDNVLLKVVRTQLKILLDENGQHEGRKLAIGKDAQLGRRPSYGDLWSSFPQ